MCVIKNPEFPEIQTVIILVALIQYRPKETLDTWTGVNPTSSVSPRSPPPLSGVLGKGQTSFVGDLINQPFSSPMKEEQNIPNCQTGDKNTLPAGNLKISPEQNKELISPPGTLKRDMDPVIADDWKLEKIACCGGVAI